MHHINHYFPCPAISAYVPQKPANIGDFGDVEMRAFTLSDDGKVWACLPEHGSTKEPCKVCLHIIRSQFSREGRGMFRWTLSRINTRGIGGQGVARRSQSLGLIRRNSSNIREHVPFMP